MPTLAKVVKNRGDGKSIPNTFSVWDKHKQKMVDCGTDRVAAHRLAAQLNSLYNRANTGKRQAVDQ